MTNDSRGYSHQLVKAIIAGDSAHVGVQLGRMCIENNISVREISQTLGVSRMTVYQWFSGRFMPRPAHVEKIHELLEQHRTSQV
jgi:predicted transcriptional regulator